MGFKRMAYRPKSFSNRQVINSDDMSGIGRSIRLKCLQSFEIHFARLCKVCEVLMSVDLFSARLDSSQTQFGFYVEKDNKVWQTCSVQSKQLVKFVNELTFGK